MSEFSPSPEQTSDRETQGVALAQEITRLRSRAATDTDYQAVLEKTLELKRLFGLVQPELKLRGDLGRQLEQAKTILGTTEVLGLQAEHIWDVKLKESEIPAIPFSVEELEAAKTLNQFLVLRIDKAANGKPLTMETMEGSQYSMRRTKVRFSTIRIGTKTRTSTRLKRQNWRGRSPAKR